MYAAEGEEQCITPASLRRMLSRLGSPQLGMEECEAMICRFDLDGDGVISFDEFRIMMQDGLLRSVQYNIYPLTVLYGLCQIIFQDQLWSRSRIIRSV
ncbi:hypothetical protein EJB05_30156, partial [Eragrostis curvula]